MSAYKKYVPFCLFVCAAVITGAILLSRIASVASMQVSAASAAPTIVIDAGHGGEDGGAVSVTGLRESQLNLEISLRLNDLLHFLGMNTKMIRTEDISVYTQGESIAQKKVSDIHERVRLVEETPNALLLSIHQNHFSQSKYRGAQVFYAQDSRELAEAIQSMIVNHLDTNNHRECKPASDIYLLEHIHCPAALVECGFLSNPAEELLLRDETYQKKLAAAVACGVIQYLEAANEV